MNQQEKTDYWLRRNKGLRGQGPVNIIAGARLITSKNPGNKTLIKLSGKAGYFAYGVQHAPRIP